MFDCVLNEPLNILIKFIVVNIVVKHCSKNSERRLKQVKSHLMEIQKIDQKTGIS